MQQQAHHYTIRFIFWEAHACGVILAGVRTYEIPVYDLVKVKKRRDRRIVLYGTEHCHLKMKLLKNEKQRVLCFWSA